MGIVFDDLGEGGLIKLTVIGQASRIDHAACTDRVREEISRGRLKALIVDASAAELPANASFSREVWDDLLAELGGDHPFAYVPPNGHDAPARQAMIAELVSDWGTCFTTAHSLVAAERWCRARIRKSRAEV